MKEAEERDESFLSEDEINTNTNQKKNENIILDDSRLRRNSSAISGDNNSFDSGHNNDDSFESDRDSVSSDDDSISHDDHPIDPDGDIIPEDAPNIVQGRGFINVTSHKVVPASYHESVTLYEQNMIKTLGSIIVGNFLADKLSDEEKKNFLIRLNGIDVVTDNRDYGKYYIRNSYPELFNLLNAHNDYALRMNNDWLKSDDPAGYYETFYKSMKQTYNIPQADAIIKDSVDALQELSDMLGKYIKEEKLTEEERKFASLYKKMADDLGHNRSFTQNMTSNPAYLHAHIFGLNSQNLQTVQLTTDIQQVDGNTELDYNIIPMEGDNWRTIVSRSKGTPVLDLLTKTYELQTAIEDYDTSGDINREELLRAYESYSRTADQWWGLSEQEFNAIKEKAPFQDDYDDHITGSRAARYTKYDMEARVQLLKAGFPVSDINAVSVFYVMMKKCEYEVINNSNNAEISREIYESLSATWKEVMDSTPVTASNRVQLMNKLVAGLIPFTLPDKAEELSTNAYGTTLVENIKRTAKGLRVCRDTPLSLREQTELSGTAADLFNLLNNSNIDPKLLGSSDQFKKMKEAVKKLSEVDRKADPMKYEVLRDEAYRYTREYVEHKREENMSAGHKRSSLEARRVLTANTVLETLDRMKRDDKIAENKRDKRTVVDTDMSADDAGDFIKGYKLLDQSRENMLSTFKAFKTTLQNTQGEDGKDKNFENVNDMTGSDLYRNMTQSLQKCIDILSVDSSSFRDMQNALTKFRVAARTYYNERKGTFSGPRLPEGQARLVIAERAYEKTAVFIPMIDNLRMGLDNFKTNSNLLYRDMPLSDIGKKSRELEKAFENDIFPVQVDNDAFNESFELTAKQRSVRNLVTAKNETFTKNVYYIDYKADYYSALRKGASISELAKDIVAKKYLDSIYKKGLESDELDKLAAKITDGSYDKEVKALSTDPIFKSIATKYPDKLFSKWEKIEKRAEKIMEKSRDNLDKYASGSGIGGGPYEFIDDYITAAVSAEFEKQKTKNRQSEHTIVDVDEMNDEILNLKFDDLFPEMKEKKDELVREFQEKNGRLPSEEEIFDKIVDAAPFKKHKKSKKVEVKPVEDNTPSPLMIVCSDVMTNYLLADEKYGKIISEAIAADPNTKPSQAVNSIKQDVLNFMTQEVRKTKLNPKDMIGDPKKMEKAYKHVLEAQKNKVAGPEKDAPKKAVKKQAVKNIKNNDTSRRSSDSFIL